MRKLLVCLLFAIVSSAQQPPTRAIYLTATHQSAPATDLLLSDLNVRGLRGVSLERLADTPLWVGVLIDNSGSLRGPGRKERVDGITEGLPIMLRSGMDEAMLVNFSDYYYLDQPGTTDVSLITRTIREKADTRGGSAILDSLRAASEYLLKHPHAALPRVIFLFSDCADNASHSNSDQTLRQLQLNGTRLYVFKEPSDGRQLTVEQHGAEMLKMLADKTGGRVINVDYGKKSKHRLVDAFKSIEPELRSWYRLYVEVPPAPEAKVIVTPFKIQSSGSNFEVRSQSDFITVAPH